MKQINRAGMILSILFLVAIMIGAYMKDGIKTHDDATATIEARMTETETVEAERTLTPECGEPCWTYTPSATMITTETPEPSATPTCPPWCYWTAAPEDTATNTATPESTRRPTPTRIVARTMTVTP